ncbi:MAG: 2-oxoglutarate dehydrogenase complex dihydrolipoyllysine-residue succinyltransferase [Anaerolineales bacterium]|nr:2-oxoglutarate dehydrogenase complex dihydrolipoyllysine-residue succinyltransferase [Anaerolineales bacterium]
MAVEIVVPELGESIVEATVSRWLKQQGEPVSLGEAVVELETDKVNLEVPAAQAGILASIRRQEGEDVQIGDVLGVIEAAPAGTAPPSPVAKGTPPEKESPPAKPPSSAGEAEKATPLAKRMAQSAGLDLAQIPHQEAEERITKRDVERYLDGQKEALRQAQDTTKAKAEAKEGQREAAVEAKPAAKTPDVLPTPTGDRARREERVRMSRRRRTIAQRLVEAQHTAAMLTTFNEIDISAVMELRQRRQETFQKRHGIKLGFMSFFVKATVGALKQFPLLNAEIEGDEIIVKHYYDIGMAIGAEGGLVVPVIREADRLTFAEIEQMIGQYVEKAQSGTLSLEDLRGGTFSITNGGVYGSLLSTPILNPPQVGILGLHKIEKRPIALNEQVVIRPMMYVALSYDHRIVDGREAVQFLVRLKELIEDPETLLLEG